MLWMLPTIALFFGGRILAAWVLELSPWRLPRTGAFWRRAVVALAGPLACMLALLLCSAVVHIVWGVPRPNAPCLDAVSANSPAAEAGLVMADCIVSIDGHLVATAADVVQRVDATHGRLVPIELNRGGVHQTVTAVARPDGSHHRLGVRLDGSHHYERVRLWTSVEESLRFSGRIAAGFANALATVSIGSQPNVALVGPVGIVRMTKPAESPPHLYLAAFGSQIFLVGVVGLLLSLIL